MDFLKTNYDRVLLIVAGLMLVGITAYMAMGMSGIRADFPLPTVASKGAPFEADAELARLASEAPRLREPEKSGWGEADQALFVSRVYLLREGQLVDILESDTELVPGISNAWILKYKLDYTDSNLGQTDPDRDAFTNSEEFRAGTDPTDPKSKPAPWTKLRLASSKIEKLRTKFESLPRGDLEVAFDKDTEFSVNTLDYSSPTQFLKVGQKIAGSELEIIKAEAKSATNQLGATVDVSELTLKDASTGDTIILVNEKEVDSPYSFAILKNSITGEEVRVEKGKTFNLGPEAVAYKLVDVGSGGAVISPLQSEGERLPVPPLVESETPAPQTAQ